MSDNDKQLIGSQIRSSLCRIRLSNIDIFGEIISINNLQSHGLSVNNDTFDNELEYYYKSCGTCVESHVNQNITGPRK